MTDPGFSEISADAFKAYLSAHHEKDYLLVDVRQPVEYDSGHIPGATFLSLLELESRLFDLPPDKELIFYCRSGARSAAAASLAADAEISTKNIYSLAGGILGWQGRMLAGFPKVQAFDKARQVADLLHTAMDLEKGAWRFYRHLIERFGNHPIADTIEELAKAETAHARLVYHFWKQTAESPEPFEPLFDSLPGDILEGGEPLADVLQWVDTRENDPCIEVIELALHIEYSAYDLYRAMAGRADSPDAQDALLSIAQAEKAHMYALTRAIERCR